MMVPSTLIIVGSRPGAGSVFRFTVAVGLQAGEPSLRRDGPANVRDTVAQATVALRGARLLLVEDNEINRAVAVELLSGSDIVAEVAANGREALELLDRESFDGVLMDLQMPVTDGFTACRAIRRQERFRDLPVIAMTANAMQSDRETSLAAGMNDHVAKPVNPDRLMLTLARWVHPRQRVAAQSDSCTAAVAAVGQAIPDLPGVDTAAGLKVARNDTGLYRRLLCMFRDRYADFDVRFRAAQADDDPEAATRLAHSLKGVAANLGAHALAEAAQQLERVSRAQPERIEAALAGLLVRLQPITAALGELSARLRAREQTARSD
jgi:polar amino acid transport system substrate-binding protein